MVNTLIRFIYIVTLFRKNGKKTRNVKIKTKLSKPLDADSNIAYKIKLINHAPV